MSGHDEDEDEDGDGEILWNCDVCHLLVVGELHCPYCGACAPWGCGFDHDDDDDDDDEDEGPAEFFFGPLSGPDFLIEGPYGDPI